MLLTTIGGALVYYFLNDSFEVAPKPAGAVYYTEVLDSKHSSFARLHQPVAIVKPLAEAQFRGIVKQSYDYSCGSAALTTLLNGYIGRHQAEKETMDGLLKYGEYDKIVERRSFSLLDMKRYVNALGLDGGGFKGDFSDLTALTKPAIVPIEYAGFKHFVVFKGARDGRVYVADPALGNVSFDQERFKKVWNNNTLFVIEPAVGQETAKLLDMTDADMRHVADATMRQDIVMDTPFQLTTMEKNRDRASTLQRVLDADKKSLDVGQPIDTSLRLYYQRK